MTPTIHRRGRRGSLGSVSYTHLRAHETSQDLVCRLLLEPVRRSLAEWLPFPPRIEVSSLGDAAVLTGALAVGRRAALDNVFVNRKSATAS